MSSTTENDEYQDTVDYSSGEEDDPNLSPAEKLTRSQKRNRRRSKSRAMRSRSNSASINEKPKESNEDEEKRKRLRQKVLEEIVDTEDKYLRDLVTMMIYYIKPLRDSNRFPELDSIGKGDVKVKI
jgi:hypothetical protein